MEMEKKKDAAAGGKSLQKQNTWSPDIQRNEAWERRRRSLMRKSSSSSSSSSPLQRLVTDDDLQDLRGSLDLGFGFDNPPPGCAACSEDKARMLETLPALDLYYAVKGGGGGPEGCTCGGSSEPSPIGSPLSILSPGDPPETVKMRLKQWAQVVAMSVRKRP